MHQIPDSKRETRSLSLSDELAVGRTLLANERTLLAYLRSGVALLIAGVTIMHFATEQWFWLVGLACMPFGMIASVAGIVRYRVMKRKIKLLCKQLNDA